MAAEVFSENLNIPCKERQDLLYELGKALRVDNVPAPFWACLQVCDLGQLKVIVDNARQVPWFVSSFAKHCSHQIPELWLQAPQQTDEDSASTDTDDILFEQCCQESLSTESFRRDGGSCVFKRCEPMVIAHIYPNFNEKGPHAVTFWDLMSILWSPEKLKLWKELIFCEPKTPTRVTHACYNSICISPEIYRMWRMGAFAIQPLEYNSKMTELEVEWHWLPNQEHSIYDSVPLNKCPLSSSGLNSIKSKSNNLILLLVEFSSEDMRRVKTGDRFVLKTKDPEHLPLPSKDLLELQFHLQRIVSMAGAAGVDRLSDSYHDDDTPTMSNLQASYVKQWLESCVSAENKYV